MTTTDRAARIAELQEQEQELIFTTFDGRDAWELGTLLTTSALSDGLPAVIDIRKPGMILFRSSPSGTTEDVERWIARKSALALRLEKSSALVTEQIAARGVDPFAHGWLDPSLYALAGGSVPVRVAGAGVVAAVTVSRLTSEEAEHDLAVRCMREHIARQVSSARR